MRKLRLRGLLGLVAVFATVAAGCGSETPTAGGSSTGATGVCATYDTSADDALAHVCENGVLRVATDQKYRPQSWYDVKDEEWKGFDVEVAKEIAIRLGASADIQHHDWETDVTAGSWNDRYDMNVGSMTITTEREQKFYFTTPYYYTPAVVAVLADDTSVQDLTTDLDGRKICVGGGTTYQFYLQHDLNLPDAAPKFDYVIDNADILTAESDDPALDDLSLGRCDAAISASPTIDTYIEEVGGLKIVGDPLFYEPLGIAFDKNDPVDNTSLVDAVSKIVDDMHTDGTLTSLSKEFYHGEDLTAATTT